MVSGCIQVFQETSVEEFCGDGYCNVNETCSNCKIDCGNCSAPSYCGDSVCGINENCETCSVDCGACPAVCGNSVCDIAESCSVCPIDCGACPTVCGNNICELTEDCSNCIKDCGCAGDKYCDNIGICRSLVCGDDTCSDDEIDSCCEDCGCLEGEICNENIQVCQEIVEDEIDFTEIVNTYMEENSIEGTITKISDEYYGEQIVKQASIDCGTSGIPYPCQIILFIDNDGTILEEMRTG